MGWGGGGLGGWAARCAAPCCACVACCCCCDDATPGFELQRVSGLALKGVELAATSAWPLAGGAGRSRAGPTCGVGWPRAGGRACASRREGVDQGSGSGALQQWARVHQETGEVERGWQGGRAVSRRSAVWAAHGCPPGTLYEAWRARSRFFNPRAEPSHARTQRQAKPAKLPVLWIQPCCAVLCHESQPCCAVP